MPRPRKPQHRRGYVPGKHGPYGEGSIYPTKAGTWRGKFYWTDPPTKTRRAVYVTGRDEADVLARWAARRATLEKPTAAAAKAHTLGSFLTVWLDEVLKRRARTTTYEMYTRFLGRVCEHIGPVPLAQLTTADLERTWRALEGPGRGQWSPITVRTTNARLRTALNYAVRKGWIADNPALDVDRVRVPRKERIVLTPEELARVFAVANSTGERLAALWPLLATAGLRRGEAAGLRWQDVDLVAGLLSVRGQIVRTEAGLVRSEAKTDRAVRDVRLMPQVVAALLGHRARQQAERLACRKWQEHDLVFCRENGAPYEPRTFDNRWTRLLVRAGVRHVRLHDLRHGVATHMMRAGVPPKVVADLLGHADLKTTLEIYTQTVQPEQDDAVARLQRRVFGEDDGPVESSAC